MKIGVVGSRTFSNYPILEGWLLNLLEIKMGKDEKVVISGGASGADTLAGKFVESNNAKIYHPGLSLEVYLPDWNKNGKAAGFIRNQQIVDNSDIIVAFWDGKSKGTKDTIDKARRAKKPTFIVYF